MRVVSVTKLTALAATALLSISQAHAGEPKVVQPADVPLHSTLMPHETVVMDEHMDDHQSCDKDKDCGPRAGFFGDYLYLRPRGVDIPFARVVNGCGPNPTPLGPQGFAHPDWSSGFRVGGFVGLDENSCLQVTYSRLENNNRDRLEANANDGSVVNALVTLPNTGMCAAGSSQTAFTNLDIDFDIVDVEYKHAFCSGCNYSLDWLAGVRYANLSQEFNSVFTINGETDVNTHIHFDGVGPRIGLEGEHAIGCGVLVYGRGNANFLAGHFNSEFRQTNQFAGVQGVLNASTDRIVPILDLELGIGWASKNGNIRIEAGYYVSAWFNAVTTPDFIQASQTGNFTTNGDNFRDTITFDGLAARVGFRF